jgi:hypothetical protein
MRVPHTLGKDEVRRRMESRLGRASEKASNLIGGMAQVEAAWSDADHLTMTVSSMGFTVPSAVTIEETQLLFDVEIPAGMGFARGMIETMVREKGRSCSAEALLAMKRRKGMTKGRAFPVVWTGQRRIQAP